MAQLPYCASCRASIKPGQNVVFRTDGRVEHAACPEVLCLMCSLPVRPDDPIRRDGEALLHGNCWMRRERGAPKPPTKIMPTPTMLEPDGITSAVRAKLMTGTLPRIDDGQKVWVRLGKGLLCSACDQPIDGGEVEHEVDPTGNGTGLRFHRTCLNVWQREVGRGGREIAGGSAASPWTLFFDVRLARRAAGDRAAYGEFRAATAEGWLIVADTRARSRRLRAARERFS